ncbi:MAG: M28 family peptidase [Bdellovibrionaceae bacterium]|nr:M28 family peptidase [Pseudobdellovibrionaceae bacterium]MDW8191071.1 M28 family peptidase [Pseudobdellovibrionaceae bacterium]
MTFLFNILLVRLLLNSAESNIDQNDPKLITNRKQITYFGARAGEAYFNSDGTKLVFQAEREPHNPFYQIYEMDLVTGQVRLLSTGRGKTTCAWYHPHQNKILFASTHLDPNFKNEVAKELEERAKPVKGKYSWSFDPFFDIFELDLNTKKLTRLTSTRGYDAEGSYSPDGQWILFASNRSGYEHKHKLTAEEQSLFEKDPSSQMELYIMRVDGTSLKRLTHHLGYDGGPFFSADGQKIVWRRFNANGTFAEIWIMDRDGSNQKPLTKWQSMSWAPFFHPSGDYVIFTSNKLGYQNFELFIVDVQGTKEPVRVTYLEDFDGLPVFSPDGNRLVWTRRLATGESQLVMADWDDTKARQLLGLSPRLPTTHELRVGYHQTAQNTMKRVVAYLADPAMGGRLTGSPEEKLIAEEISDRLKNMGWLPFFKEGYIKTFSFVSHVELGEKNHLNLWLKGEQQSVTLNTDYLPFGISEHGNFDKAKVAFAGYGIVAPGSIEDPAYNSYQDIDVKGKWVLVLRDIPQDIPVKQRLYLSSFARIHHKALVAKQRGAIGLLVARGPLTPSKKELADLTRDGVGQSAGLPVLSVTDRIAAMIVKHSNIDLTQWQKLLDRGEHRAVSELSHVEVSAHIDLIEKRKEGRSVIARLDPLSHPSKKYWVLGAHMDHLGRGETGTSLAKNNDVGLPHVGADDNASGVAVLLGIAARLSQEKKTNKGLKESLVIAFWSGEEMGMLGSQDFLKEVSTKDILGYINFDMVGRLRDALVVQGVGSAKEWKRYLEPPIISNRILSVTLQEDPYLPTDSLSFYLKEIPTISFFTKPHAEYHTPQDTVETINFEGMERILNFALATIKELAHTAPNREKLIYQKFESFGGKSFGRRQFRVFIGTIPDYTQENIKGMKISGVSQSSPAQKGGLQAGDIIIEVDGAKIDNIYDYVYVLQSLKPKEPVRLKVLRGNKIIGLSVTPELRE